MCMRVCVCVRVFVCVCVYVCVCVCGLQGKLAKLPCVDHSVSHTISSNATISDEILTLCVKARLQVLPTKYNLSLWFPSTHSPICLLHDPPQHLESVAHIMNSSSSNGSCTDLRLPGGHLCMDERISPTDQPGKD